MSFFKITRRFAQDEDGAVTVDWVVLTAAIVGLAVAIVALVRGGLNSYATDISNALVSATVASIT